MLRAMASPINVVLWGTYDQDVARVRLVEAGLRAQGGEVRVCHYPVWPRSRDKLVALAGGDALRVFFRLLCAYPVLIWRYLRLPRHDVVLVCHPGLLDVWVIRPWAWLRGVRVAWDIYVSPYDTVVLDRAWLRPMQAPARLLWHLERLTWRVVEHPFVDTVAHARRLESLFQQSAGRCGTVWIGAESPFWSFTPTSGRAARAPLNILFYGSFLPLHGVSVVIAAARLLEHLPVRWTLMGTGPEASAIKVQLAQSPLSSVQWVPPVAYESLPVHIHGADLVLGVFGTTAKAESVIPNKVYQALAAGKPVVTRDGPGVQELLGHRPPWLYLVPPGDAEALAAAVVDFFERPGESVAENPHRAVLARLTPKSLGRQLLEVLRVWESRSP